MGELIIIVVFDDWLSIVFVYCKFKLKLIESVGFIL